LLRGWDQEGSNGANLSFPQEFGIACTNCSSTEQQRNDWIVGTINSGSVILFYVCWHPKFILNLSVWWGRPYISASLISCWLTDPLNHYLGRRGTLFFCGIFCMLSVIGSACAQSWPQLFVRWSTIHHDDTNSDHSRIIFAILGYSSPPRYRYGPQSVDLTRLRRR
jgi:hypothetical protein